MKLKAIFNIFAAIITGLILMGTVLLTQKAQAQGDAPSGLQEMQAVLGTGFTYQGHLLQDGTTVDDTCDFNFTLYDAASGGSTVGTVQAKSGVTVADGIFTVPELDFGSSAFAGDARYLAISVRCLAGSGSYTDLSGRVALEATPYAIYAQGMSWSGLDNVPADLADGDDDTTYTAGTGLTLAGGAFSVDTTAIQQRVSGSCSSGNAIRAINANGTVTCEAVAGGAGDITAVNAGSGLTGGGTSGEVTITVLFAGSGSATTVSRSDHEHDGRYYTESELQGDGTADIHWNNLANVPSGLADGDNDTTYTAGTGMTLAGGAFDVDTAVIQQRVSGSCSSGNAIRTVNADGTVTCEAVAGGAGDITAVTAGNGLTGGGTSGDVTVSADFAGTGSASTVSRSDHDHDSSYYTESELQGNSTASVHWNNLTNVPTGLADGDNDTTYTAGTGMALAGGAFSVHSTYRLPQSCSDDQLSQWDSSSSIWTCVNAPASGWSLTGNSGTNHETTFIGTTDNVTLTFRVNNGTALRLLPEGNFAVNGQSILAGNADYADAVGNTIGGGRDNEIINGNGAAAFNGIHDNTIGGGNGNVITNTVWGGTISGGDDNVINGAWWGTIAGGSGNFVSGGHSFAAGEDNSVTSSNSFAIGTNARAIHSNSFVWSDGTVFSSTNYSQFAVRATGGILLSTGSADININDNYTLPASGGSDGSLLQLNSSGDASWVTLKPDMLQFTPQSSAPTTCDASVEGAMAYASGSNQFCYCRITGTMTYAWVEVYNRTSSCTW